MFMFLVIVLSIAVFTDFKIGKIPNVLIVFGSITAIFAGQPPGDYYIRAVLVILFFFPFYLIKALGAGDIKCFSMIALYLDSDLLLSSILYAFLIAALLSVLMILKNYFPKKEVSKLRCITIHLAFPILTGVLISIGGELICTIS